MKRIQWRSRKFYCLLLSALTAIILFVSSCKEEAIKRPSATFIIKGTVLSAEDQKPLEDILVTMLADTAGNGPLKDALLMSFIDSVRTDKEGKFTIIDSMGIPAQMAYTLLFNEKKNNLKSYAGKIDTFLTVQFKNPIFSKGDDQWYRGETLKADTFLLTPAK